MGDEGVQKDVIERDVKQDVAAGRPGKGQQAALRDAISDDLDDADEPSDEASDGRDPDRADRDDLRLRLLQPHGAEHREHRGRAVPQRERQVMEFAILGELVLTVEDGIITGPLARVCDTVTAGPAAWPYEGLPAEPPDRAGPAPPDCVEPIDPGARCVPDL